MIFTFAYGWMSTEFEMLTRLVSPDHIAATDAERNLALRARNLALERISWCLWPIFEPQRPTHPLGATVEALIDADIAVLREMQADKANWNDTARRNWSLAYHCEDSIYEKIGTPILGGAVELYRTGFAASFARFVLKNESAADSAVTELGAAFSAHSPEGAEAQLRDWIVLSLKHAFQRPRPYQVAYDRANTDFSHKRSASAHTPALPSGHAFDSAFAAILAASNLGSTNYWHAHLDRLPAWAATVADRRIYGGLHYPSDNWASWICAATVIELCFTSQAIASAKSRLAQNVEASVCFKLSSDKPAFEPGKRMLESLLGRDLASNIG